MRIFFDSAILIWHLRGDARARGFFMGLQEKENGEWWIGALTRAEIVFFMRPPEEKMTTLFLSRFSTAPVDADLIDAAAILYRRYKPSHGTDINDAVLAAIIEKRGGLLYTLNVKHFPTNTFPVLSPW